MIKTVLFDLDGTLLPMNQDNFTKMYFIKLAEKMAPLGYDRKQLVAGIGEGTMAMVKNDGSRQNEEAFWEKFTEIFGEKALEDKPVVDDFYINEFREVISSCGYNEKAKATVYKIKSMGFRVALATNPIFPAVATERRIRWTGLEPDDFELYTTYENTGFCKPNPDYYWDVLERLNCRPEECLMVGNDVTEDMIAGELGMKVFLLTDCMISKEEKDISVYPNGSFDELLDYIEKINMI